MLRRLRSRLTSANVVASLAQGAACTRYALPAPFVMEADDFLTVRFRMSWTGVGQAVRAAGTTVEHDRVP